MLSPSDWIGDLLISGTRIRLQSLLSYLFLETVDIRHHMFRSRHGANGIIGYVNLLCFRRLIGLYILIY
jgi:hypothetical protein